MSELDAKIKMAITNIGKLHTESHHRGTDGCGIAACIVVAGYVQAEARARMAEFRLEHLSCERYKVPKEIECQDPGHNRTLADYERQVIEELEKP